ncbi:SdpI family protein [Streptomyces huiliensis]|uniref:SdpI family protein n=1 Tax=Streptomyces huiliensis TaxID=2876027 RepID=UPI001CC0A398|nr:SdpI family protein [Streptomyces huiliensis]MBZ4319754.1 SdpI family protein [Streptomyces huiliensis]
MIHYVKSQVASGNIERNSMIGIRTKATMSSDDAWKAGHASASPLLMVAYLTAYSVGAVSLAISLALSLSDAENPAVIIVPLVGIVVVLALLATAAGRANSAARAAGPEGG